ncbi:DUF3445 domain-containing protein [Nitratireductor mangrovi]|uniref:DUF3445 domain-containing protein n=1 Tax=Nitratireductor mangrovi TaxID=2599600 RepID=A0A5B8L435_9HYPH|nr:DUF3445 domain-containing protein [Nitratireductor mangrovi]QDZ02761.1 DUF3445 domain-containing protein [Nitratireductor mangrovi]
MHTPYDGSSRPFTIGLTPLRPTGWIEIDEHYEAWLAGKRRLLAERRNTVFVEEPGTREAQGEALERICSHLVAGFPAIFPGTRQWEAALAAMDRELGAGHAPLVAASLLVQEDLVLMRKGEAGWRLAAGSVCFPSSWTLTEKFARPIEDIHAPVPQFGRGTRAALLINRIFDSLKPEQPVERLNWSLQTDDLLHRPLSAQAREGRIGSRTPSFPANDPIAAAFIRVERQTLTKLPLSGDILFTIRIHLDPMTVIGRHPQRQRIAASFAEQLAALDDAQLDYKGLTADRDRLVASLRTIAEDGDLLG